MSNAMYAITRTTTSSSTTWRSGSKLKTSESTLSTMRLPGAPGSQGRISTSAIRTCWSGSSRPSASKAGNLWPLPSLYMPTTNA